MTQYYAQASTDFADANWNTDQHGYGLTPSQNGSSNGNLPGAWDSVESNGYAVDVTNYVSPGYQSANSQFGGEFYTTCWYAQSANTFIGCGWSSQSGGGGILSISGSSALEVLSGSTVESNGYVIDVTDVANSSYTITSSNGGSFSSSHWYAESSGAWSSCGWTSDSSGGLVNSGTPASGNTCYANSWQVDCADVNLSGITLASISGSSLWYSSHWYAQGAGRATAVGWASTASGTGALGGSSIPLSYTFTFTNVGTTATVYDSNSHTVSWYGFAFWTYGTYGSTGYSLTGSGWVEVVFPAASHLLSGDDRGDGTIGTLDLTTYVLKSNVVSTDYVVMGHNNYVGGSAGTYVSGTIPSASDVRYGTAVGSTTGTAYIPAASDVRHGTNVDATTGTCYVPTAAQTLYGVNVDATTGTVTLPNTDGHTPDASLVLNTAHFGAGNATAGTYVSQSLFDTLIPLPSIGCP